MSKALYKNNAESITSVAALTTDLTITLATGDGVKFPAPAVNQHAIVTLTDGINFEIVKVTGNAADVLTIVRAQEGTTALAWTSGTTVSQRMTAQVFENLLNLDGNGTGEVIAGSGSGATGTGIVAIGKSCQANQNSSLAMGDLCTTTGVLSTAIGKSNTAAGRNTVAIGKNCTTGTEDEAVSLGIICNAAGYYSVAVGSNCSATGYYGSVALGSNAMAIGDLSVSLGIHTNASGANSLAVGNTTSASSASSIAIGDSALVDSFHALAIGFNAYASGSRSIAIGDSATNPIAGTTVMTGALMVRKSFVTSRPNEDFAGAEVVLMTEALPMGSVGNKVISLPVGSVFIPTSAGVLITDQTGVITTQPTVQVSASTDNITFTPLTAAVLTTALNAPRKFQDLAIGAQTSAGLYLKGEVTVAGVSTLLYNARFYFKGIVVQE